MAWRGGGRRGVAALRLHGLIPVAEADHHGRGRGEVLPTPTGTASFVVDQLDAEGLSLLFGPKKTRTLLTWRCLEEVPGYLRGQGWVLVGANRDVNGDYGLDGDR